MLVQMRDEQAQGLDEEGHKINDQLTDKLHKSLGYHGRIAAVYTNEACYSVRDELLGEVQKLKHKVKAAERWLYVATSQRKGREVEVEKGSGGQ